MSVSIIIPAYNEEQRLPITLGETFDYFAKRSEPFEILVVDDGSRDATPQIVADFAASHAASPIRLGIKCLSYGGNRGKGYAVRYAMLRAQGDLRLFCDADLATPVEEYDIVLTEMREKQAQIGIGSRPLRESRLMVHQPWYRELLGRTFNKAVKLFAVSDIDDTQCGFKIFTAAAAQDVFSRCRLDGFAFDIEALYIGTHLGYTVAEVPIRWSHKAGSKVNMLRDGARMLCDLATVRWLHRRLKPAAQDRTPSSVASVNPPKV
jgi:dolichyl-phosphate beta-glucosyltransferase